MAIRTVLWKVLNHEFLHKQQKVLHNMSIKMFLWDLRRKLHLSPTQNVFRKIEKRGIPLKHLITLEVFGNTGHYHTKDYASLVGSLDVWEIDSKMEPELKHNLPMAKVKITDSYKEIKNTPKKYNLIAIDNPETVHGTHVEHFDLFPDIFRVAMDSTILVVNVIPNLPIASLSNEAHLAARRSFYNTDHPERLSFEEMIDTYKDIIEANGFNLEWYFFQQRTLDARLHYLVAKIERRANAGSPAHSAP